MEGNTFFVQHVSDERTTRQNLAADLNCGINQINIKATTTEQLGFEGREEGIACHAVALILADGA